jgi:hypothetical protein
MRDRYSRERRRAIESMDEISRRVPLGQARDDRWTSARRVLRKKSVRTTESDVRCLIQAIADVSQIALDLISENSDRKTTS